MKKLLLAPFLLANLFSFGGELKSHPDSSYELPNPRSSLSESQSNSNDVWYLLTQTEIQWKGNKYVPFKGWSTVAFEKLKISKYGTRSICQRLASEKKRWINQIDLGRSREINYRHKVYTKCINGIKENNAKYSLNIASISMRNHEENGNNFQTISPSEQSVFSSFDTLFFQNLSKCNLAKSKLDNWFTFLENSFLNNSHIFLRYSTKCFSKT